MKAIYRTTFRIKAASSMEETQAALTDLCYDWIFEKKRGLDSSLRPETGLATMPETPLGKGYTCETIRHDDLENNTFWALRFRHADQDDPSISWITEITHHPAQNGSIHFCCSLLLGRSDNTYAPVVRPATRPKIVPLVLSNFEHDTQFLKLSSEPLKCGVAQMELLLQLLTHSERKHPVVLMSTSNGELVTGAKRIAFQLAGLAHVIVAADDEVGNELQKVIPPSHAVFNGGIRIYWPGYKTDGIPYYHPLFTQFRLKKLEDRNPSAIAQMLLDRISQVFTYSLSPSFLTWDKLISHVRQARLEEAKQKGEIEEMAELYAEENDSLRFNIEQLKEELEERAREAIKAKEEVEIWKSSYIASQQSDSEEAERPPVATVEEAVFYAQKDYPDNLVFALNNKSNIETDYQEPSEVRDAFAWLAGPYLSARLGEKSISDLDKSIKENVSSWFWKGGQSSTTTGKYSEWYQATYQGKSYDVCEHIGVGSSKSPRETVRIGFCCLKEERKILVGFIGQHQRTGKT